LKSPASASNLEQGNILSPIQHSKDSLRVELGFSYSGQVFFDYLMEAEVYQKLLNNLADYFELEISQIHLDMKQLASGEDFLSQADIRESLAKKNQVDKIEEFKNNPLLKEAEKIFNSKVDKVILENKK
jgi:DNA polymerase-3 subunit gamma/tau